MKIVSAILSIFLLGLSLLPCDDVAEDNCDEEVHYHVTTEGHEHDTDVDLCSPFCQCQCCLSHVTFLQVFYINLERVANLVEPTTYFANAGDDIKSSLFQPPRG